MSNLICCFIFSSDNQNDKTRANLDLIKTFIIEPVLSSYNADLLICDDSNQDSIDAIKRATFCIAELSTLSNAIYYKMGLCEGYGKPLIVLDSQGADLKSINFYTGNIFQYDFSNSTNLLNLKKDLDDKIKNIVMLRSEDPITLVSKRLDTMENSIMNILCSMSESHIVDNSYILFNRAVKKRNAIVAEYAMSKIEQNTNDKSEFYDYYVELAASIGSKKAGDMLFEYADTFMKSPISNQKKCKYLGALISYLNVTNQEEPYCGMIENMAQLFIGNDDTLTAYAYNQLNRLYNGIYANIIDSNIDDAMDYLKKAVDCLDKAISLKNDEPSYYFNRGQCWWQFAGRNQMDEDSVKKSVYDIKKCLELEKAKGEIDSDYIKFAEQVSTKVDDAELSELIRSCEALSQSMR